MAHLRRVLAPVTAIWLFCQVGTVALVPVTQWIPAVEAHGPECPCGHAPGSIGPMHHKPTAGAARSATPAATTEAAGLTLLAGTVGLITQPIRSIRPPLSSESLRNADVDRAGERPVPPEPPPPRV